MGIRKATKEQSKLRMFISGPSGSGKTYTAMKIASRFGNKIGVIDTEYRSSERYADEFEFEVYSLDNPSLEGYTDALDEFKANGNDIVVIDSASHAWYAAQEMVEQVAARSRDGNSFRAWGEVTPKWNKFLRNIQSMPFHVIVTARSKVEYILEKDERTGKSAPKKHGMAAIMREGTDYEFDVAGEMDLKHNLYIMKTRCKDLDNKVFEKPDKEPSTTLLNWLASGVEPVAIDPQVLFNDYVKPEINKGRLTVEQVKTIVKDAGGDYLKALAVVQG